MKSRFILLLCIISIGMFACGGGTSTEETKATAETETTTPAKPEQIEIKHAPMTVTPSTAKDYPDLTKELGFPIHPKAEVYNVGNAVLDGDGLFMRVHIQGQDIKGTSDYYDKEMTNAGWKKEDINVFKGADAAARYISKDGKVICRIITMKEPDYLKMAVTMNKAVDISKYQ